MLMYRLGGPFKPDIYNVLDPFFGARGDGVTDDTAAINAAINTASSQGGGIIYFPNGTYLISSTLTITADDIWLMGVGFDGNGGSKIIASSPLASLPMIKFTTASGTIRGSKISDLRVEGNSVTGVIGVQLDSTYHAELLRVNVSNCLGTGILGTGTSGTFGAHTMVLDCIIGCGAGAQSTTIGLTTQNHEWLTIMGGLFTFFNTTGAQAVRIGNLNCRIVGVGFDQNDTAISLQSAGRNLIVGCQFDRGQTQYILLHNTKSNIISGNSFNNFNGTGSQSCIVIDSGTNSTYNAITGNTVMPTSGWTNFVSENVASVGPNSYTGNTTNGLPMVLKNNSIALGNPGYNPVGHITSPGIPVSGTPLTNQQGTNMSVFITGGTVTAISIGGTATGFTSGLFYLPVGQTITLTYSAAPSWTWYGD